MFTGSQDHKKTQRNSVWHMDQIKPMVIKFVSKNLGSNPSNQSFS